MSTSNLIELSSRRLRASAVGQGGAGARRHSAIRRLQRGVTVYVVVLVIAMLSAVGVFAAKSASLALAQGGYVRQSTQTHYIAEYSVDAALAAISTDVPGYVQQFENFDNEGIAASTFTDWQQCRNGVTAASGSGQENGRCYKFGREGLEERFSGGSTPLLAARDIATGDPGSLGRFDVDANFVVEATDLAQLMAPRAGERTSGAPVSYYALTLSAVGDVGPPRAVAGSQADQLRTGSTSVEAARIQVTLGPVPAR